MIYVVEVDGGGTHKVWAARSLDHYIDVAGKALAARGYPAPQTFEGVKEVAGSISALYRVYETPIAAMAAYSEGKLPPETAAKLKAALDRHAHVAMRGFGLSGGA